MNYDGCEDYCGEWVTKWNDEHCEQDFDETCRNIWDDLWKLEYSYEPDRIKYDDFYNYIVRDGEYDQDWEFLNQVWDMMEDYDNMANKENFMPACVWGHENSPDKDEPDCGYWDYSYGDPPFWNDYECYDDDEECGFWD